MNRTLLFAFVNFTFPVRISPHIPEWELNLWFTTTILICVLGGGLIIFLLVVMAAIKRLHTGSGVLIAHLECVELIMCLGVHPMHTVSVYLHQTNHVVHVNCTAAHFALVTMSMVHQYSNMFLAINRFVAIVVPGKYSVATSNKALVGCLVFSWTVAWGMCLVVHTGHHMTIAMLPSGVCLPVKLYDQLFAMTTVFGTFIPNGLIGCLYVTIFIYQMLRDRARVIPVLGNYFQRQRELTKQQQRLNIAKVLFCSLLWSVLCLCPAPVMSTKFPEIWRHSVRAVLWTRTIMVLGLAMNPVFFFGLSREYRTGAIMVIRNMRNSLIRLVSPSDTEKAEEDKKQQEVLQKSLSFKLNAPAQRNLYVQKNPEMLMDVHTC